MSENKKKAGRPAGSPDRGVLLELAEADDFKRGRPPAQKGGGRPTKLSLQRAQKDLNDRQLAYVMWAATPAKYREPTSMAGFAESVGVSEVTVWRWSKNPKVINAIRWMVLNNAGDPTRVSKIIDFLTETAEDEDNPLKYRLQAAKEFLDAVGVKQMWKNPTPDLLTTKDVDEIDLDQLSDEEVWELYNERSGANGPALNSGGSDA